MRVLLLGGNGQLGSDIRSAHQEAGEPFELSLITRDRLDVAKPGMVEEILTGLDFDAIINCASYHITDEVEDNASLAFAVNAHAVQAMARACAAKRARLFHVSTDYVFGGAVWGRPLREDDPTAPVNVYGASKAMGETLARLAYDDVVIVRVASLFGTAGASGKGGNFVETILRVAKEKKELRVVVDQVMSPTATGDAAAIMHRMLAAGCAPGTYHAVNGGAVSWYEFACEIVRRAGIDVDVMSCSSEEYPTRAMRPRYSALDNAKVSNTFGAMPPWQDALECYLRAKGHV